MIRGVFLFFFMLMNSLMFAQIGVEVEVPTEMVDVNGTMRIRNTDYLNDESLKPLFINNEGVLGIKVFKEVQSQVFSAQGLNNAPPLGGSVEFNSRKRIHVPINVNDVIVNNLGLSHVGDALKINTPGFYNYKTSVNIRSKVNTEKDGVWVFTGLETSSDNGQNWETRSLSLHKIKKINQSSTGSSYNGEIRNLVIPSIVYEHKKGDLVRIFIVRSASGSGSGLPQGDEVTAFELFNDNGLKTYNLIISKM
ncbi:MULTISPECIES: hypothetical protein [Myroides]|uniref:Uncharacterized protein n=1 Tax=Myroides albus TaxID=2562892 RepID=A0A6I3LNZ3_9FLAO|nr:MULTISPECIES: hypothetical protein [Myroides]MTG99487.1 hypothetical protein [Myroides albus]MVX37021.1 hypothetical protein [Myroides sp. LoEW2-1]